MANTNAVDAASACPSNMTPCAHKIIRGMTWAFTSGQDVLLPATGSITPWLDIRHGELQNVSADHYNAVIPDECASEGPIPLTVLNDIKIKSRQRRRDEHIPRLEFDSNFYFRGAYGGDPGKFCLYLRIQGTNSRGIATLAKTFTLANSIVAEGGKLFVTVGLKFTEQLTSGATEMLSGGSGQKVYSMFNEYALPSGLFVNSATGQIYGIASVASEVTTSADLKPTILGTPAVIKGVDDNFEQSLRPRIHLTVLAPLAMNKPLPADPLRDLWEQYFGQTVNSKFGPSNPVNYDTLVEHHSHLWSPPPISSMISLISRWGIPITSLFEVLGSSTLIGVHYEAVDYEEAFRMGLNSSLLKLKGTLNLNTTTTGQSLKDSGVTMIKLPIKICGSAGIGMEKECIKTPLPVTIRFAAEQKNSEQNTSKRSNKKDEIIWATPVALVLITTVIYSLFLIRRHKAARKQAEEKAEIKFPVPDAWELTRESLFLGDELGRGAFGIVCSATASIPIKGQPAGTKMAVKQCGTSASVTETNQFIYEGELMKRFNHRNVLRLLGVCLQEKPLLIVVEFMANGDLVGFLRNCLSTGIQVVDIYRFTIDVASGLAYLASLGFVHRDLACRNCLLDAERVVKIADFGMARDIAGGNSDYYRLNHAALLPVRWMSPESISHGDFSLASDVWSLGVVFWELCCFCETPYPALGNSDVVEAVIAGKRLGQPPLAPAFLYELCLQCWNAKPFQRPSAQRVVILLQEGYTNIGIDVKREVNDVSTQIIANKNYLQSNTKQTSGCLPLSSKVGLSKTGMPSVPSDATIINDSTSAFKHSQASFESKDAAIVSGYAIVTYGSGGWSVTSSDKNGGRLVDAGLRSSRHTGTHDGAGASAASKTNGKIRARFQLKPKTKQFNVMPQAELEHQNLYFDSKTKQVLLDKESSEDESSTKESTV